MIKEQTERINILDALHISASNPGVSTGNNWFDGSGPELLSYSPVNGQFIASVSTGNRDNFDLIVMSAQEAFLKWRTWPAPRRGDVIRQIGDAFRQHKDILGELISLEMGKSLQEGKGEVQEIIDICDYAVGLSRQLYGYTMSSERPMHRMFEQYHPLGIIGIITAFNFPAAVWGWNSIIGMVCGNVSIWKPSEKTPICAIACQRIIAAVFEKNDVPEGVCSLISGHRNVGVWMSEDRRIPLVSATGSTAMGKAVGVAVAARMGKTLLELGGNNAMIISQHADLRIALNAVVFGAIGTAGQRCTSTRRVIVHESIYERFKEILVKAYKQIRIGDPLDQSNHMGPLIDCDAVATYLKAIDQCRSEGGNFIVEGGPVKGMPGDCYVYPCIAEVQPSMSIVAKETFAPILYLLKYANLEEAIRIQNDVPQGLSSSMMTLHAHEAELFLSSDGSDCGIANVNMGTSGAEIGGAFGGEKETGGGRESGSDSWKYYMRRQTSTINYSPKLPLSQGINFDFDFAIL